MPKTAIEQEQEQEQKFDQHLEELREKIYLLLSDPLYIQYGKYESQNLSSLFVKCEVIVNLVIEIAEIIHEERNNILINKLKQYAHFKSVWQIINENSSLIVNYSEIFDDDDDDDSTFFLFFTELFVAWGGTGSTPIRINNIEDLRTSLGALIVSDGVGIGKPIKVENPPIEERRGDAQVIRGSNWIKEVNSGLLELLKKNIQMN